MLILLILLLVCLLGSFFFSGTETGFFSWNRLKVSHAAGQGSGRARMAMRLINNRGQVLSTILVGNNIVNVLMTLIFAELFLRIDVATAFDLSRIPSPESWFLTPVVLLFCEIIPKSLYRTYPFKLTMRSVPLLTFFYFIMSPPYWVISRAVRFVRRRRRKVGDTPQGADVREEILLVVTEGAKRGTIFESADRLMRNTLGMKGMSVESFAVPLDIWKKTRPFYKASQLLSEFSPAVGDIGAPTARGSAVGGFDLSQARGVSTAFVIPPTADTSVGGESKLRPAGVPKLPAAGAGADEVVVFDDNLDMPAGYVRLLDVAGRGEGLATFGSLARPLPSVRGGMEALAFLRRMAHDSPRYYAVISDGAVMALLDKMEIYRSAFGKITADAAA